MSNTHGCLFCFPGLGEAMDMASKESISIPFGTGICGHVAETKETIYIKDAYNVILKQFILCLIYVIVNHFINFILKRTEGGAAVDFIITLLT